MAHPTLMAQEASQAPMRVASQWRDNQTIIADICQAIQARSVQFVMTIARGSSDHAATFAKYLFETQLGLVTASAAPSVQTIYRQALHLDNALVIAISQSGQSQDICETLSAARKAGALTIALVNQADSPLAKLAEFCIPLHAGEETAIAATKSYMTSLTALIHLVAQIKSDTALSNALQQLPASLEQAGKADWQSFIDTYQSVNSTLICGRGFGYPIAQESALKFKETCALHAEAFSSAEILHGPFALVETNYPLFVYTQNDQSLAGTLALIDKVTALQGNVLLAAASDINYQQTHCLRLPLPPSLHPICDPIIAIQAFYLAIAKLAVLRGYDPDHPQHLKKVTNTR